MISGVLKKIVHFSLLQHLFLGFFRNISILTNKYIQFLCYLEFQKVKKILKIFFLAVTRLILEKNILQPFFAQFLKKNNIINDVIIPIATILKKFFYHFFCNIAQYGCSIFHVKSIFLSVFTPKRALCAHTLLGHDKTKIFRGRQG